MTSYKNLFLRQSYLDDYDAYTLSLTSSKRRPEGWDYIILTASNEAQAEAYRLQIEHRLKLGKLPKETHYAVLPDLGGKRIGSGGATLSVMKYIREREESFHNKKILVIHSGGDSKRVPQYSACGKIFSPVPRLLPDGRRSTLFDEIIIGMTTVPSRIAEGGMFVCSGDTLLLFNPLQIDFYGGGAAALSIKESVDTGKDHGVFLGDEKGNVGTFLHKQTVETLTSRGAVDARGNVDIDSGAVIFGTDILEDLYTLIDTEEKFYRFVNDRSRLSFYGDFLYPLASTSTEEQYYKETPEGDFTPELAACRKAIWPVLHKYRMRLLHFSPAAFIHFGTTWELLKLVTDDMPAYTFLNWSSLVNTNRTNVDFAASHSYVSRRATVGHGSYIEDSYIHKNTVIGKGCVIAGVTLDGETVPDGSVLHGLKLRDGSFCVRFYSVNDNPKEKKHFGKPLDTLLWEAPIFPVCKTMREAVALALSGKTGDRAISLRDSFGEADVTAILPWQEKLDDRIKAEALLVAIDNGVPAKEAAKLFNGPVGERVIEFLDKKANELDMGDLESFKKKIRIYYYLSEALSGEGKDKYLSLCFDTIRETVTCHSDNPVIYREDAKIAKDDVAVNLPVRVNLSTGWSDAPPCCLEGGGLVLNAAITLGGQYPIVVTIKRIAENKVILSSSDNGACADFTDTARLQDCHTPADPFALHKASLLACGVIPQNENVPLSDILSRLGGGFHLTTGVRNIPRGSGLGTSSILAGACAKAIYEFLGIEISSPHLYNTVTAIEQIMTTGGGWQDQVGGLAPGIKIVSSPAGITQKITHTPVLLSKETLDELNSRYAIIYTGQRRLARNLLREVIGKYIGRNADTVEGIYEAQRCAVLMRFELERGNVDGFAKLFNRQFELLRQIDHGCTNTCIDQIFLSIDDLIDGKMICGAGGGGFLQVIMKRGVTREILRERLNSIFSESGVDVWDCEFC